jgi:hypothetical protein
MSRTPRQPSKPVLAALSVMTALWFGLTAPSLSPVAAPSVPLVVPVSTSVVSGQQVSTAVPLVPTTVLAPAPVVIALVAR